MEIADELALLKRQVDTLMVAVSNVDYIGMVVEQDIKDKAIGRVNFTAQKIIGQRVAELEFGKLERKRQELYLDMKRIAEDFPHLKTHIVEEDVPSIYK